MTRGFLGGTFDPVHLGHLSLATEALERFSLERVTFVPARFPPHKDPESITLFSHRMAMLRSVVQGNERFEVADLETRDFPAYTVDMLQRIACPGFRPAFIMGMDSLVEMHTWKDPLKIVELARVLVGVRPGFDPSAVRKELLERVELFEFPGVWISSSDIRRRIASGRSIAYLVPAEVESYIRNRGLYGAEKGHRHNS